MKLRKTIIAEVLAGLSTLALLSVPARAQTSPAEQQPENDGSVSLSAVTVTAQKREELLQDVPIPISAISGSDIRDKQINASTDIERLAPGVSAQGAPSRTGKPRWFMRGIGTNDPNSNNEGPLAIYVDEVVVGYQALQSFPIYDLERVEVLYGPQGTLWGKNNTGGAIHFVSKTPSFKNEGYARLGVGNFGSHIVEAAYGGSIQEGVLAGRASVYLEDRDGWAKNIVTGEDGPQLRDVNARFQLLGAITDNVDTLFSWTTRRVDTENVPDYTVGGLANPGSDVTLPAPGGQINQGGGVFYPPYGDDPRASDDFWGSPSRGRYTVNNLSARVNWQLGDNTLTSITALNTHENESHSQAGVPLNSTLNRTSSEGDGSSRQFTQELRLSSPRDQALSWLAGAYYYRLQLETDSRSARFASGTTREQYSQSSLDQESSSKAIFANLHYDINEKFAIGAGVRYTREDKKITLTSLTATDTASNSHVVDFASESEWALPGGVTGSGIVSPLRLSRKQRWNKFTWDITGEYRPSAEFLSYVRVATGFRSGGFNQSISNGRIIETSPETLIDYELGFKSTWLNRRLSLNGALYFYDIKDLQLNIQRAYLNTSTNTYTTSAAGASDGWVRGLELSADALITRNWHLAATLGLLRSRYTNFVYHIGNGGPFDASGNAFYRTPRTSFRIDTDYAFHVGDGRLILATDWTYRSKIYFNATVQNDPLQEADGYWKGNVRVTYEAPKKAWQLTAFVNNVTDYDKAYLRQIYNPNSGTFPVSLDAPRTFGVQVQVRF
jgi:iron complex outermembrane receptor protein